MSPAGKRWIVVAVSALTLLAAVERFVGLGFLLPHTREADTAMVHYAAYHDRPAGMAPNDALYPSTVYPLLFPKILIALPGTNYPVAAPADAPLEAHLSAAAEPYLRARRLMAFLSLLVVPCTYWIARRFLEPGWSVFAAALAATSSLALEMSPLAKPHGGLLGLSALALVGLLGLLRGGSWRAYAFAGASSALALGSLNSGVFVLPPLVLAHLLGWRADRDARRWIRFLVAIAICVGGFLVAYPFVVFGDPLQSTSRETLNFGQQAIYWDTWGIQGFLDMIPAMFAHDPALVVLVLVAVAALSVSGARGRLERGDVLRADVLVLGLYAFEFVALFGLHERFFARYFLPLYPCLCLVSAAGLRAATRLAPSRALAVVAAIAALAFPAYASFWFTLLRARDDTSTLAARWIEAHVEPGSGPIAIEHLRSLPLFQRHAAIREAPAWAWQPWQRYQVEVLGAEPPTRTFDLHPIFEPGMNVDHVIARDEVRASLARLGAKWAVVSVPSPTDAPRDETCATLREIAGEPVARILPFGPGGSIEGILTRDMDPDFLVHMLGMQRLGPPIEIFRLP